MVGSSAGAGVSATDSSDVEEPYRMQDVTYESGGFQVVATAFVTNVPRPQPAAVLIQGAGDSSRKNIWSLMIGQGLALQGIAVLVPDKRGTGDSGGDWKRSSFAELADDIRAAVAYLGRRPEVDAGSVGVVGLSQGGFYAPVVADGPESVAFVAAVSASVMPFEDTLDHEMANTFRQEGLSGEMHGMAMAVQHAAIRYVRDREWQGYDSVRAEALRAGAGEVVAKFPSTPDHWMWSWISHVIDFDPLRHWQRLSEPMFFAYGEADEQDNVPVVASVARIEEELAPGHDVTVRVYPESGHALYDPVILREKGEAEIRDDFVADLASWIRSRVAKDRDEQ